MSLAPPDLSLVVPCYREEANLIDLHSAVEADLGQNLEWELILVDDGSPNNTFQVAKDLAKQDRRVKAIGFSRNFGKEAAMLAGLEYSSGQRVVIMDGDLQHPPSLIPEMLKKWMRRTRIRLSCGGIEPGIRRCAPRFLVFTIGLLIP